MSQLRAELHLQQSTQLPDAGGATTFIIMYPAQIKSSSSPCCCAAWIFAGCILSCSYIDDCGCLVFGCSGRADVLKSIYIIIMYFQVSLIRMELRFSRFHSQACSHPPVSSPVTQVSSSKSFTLFPSDTTCLLRPQ